MKNSRKQLFLFLLVILIGTASCSKHTTMVVIKPKSNTTSAKSVAPGKSKSLPPGQAKKADGSQSAKKYAPGQQKKKQ